MMSLHTATLWYVCSTTIVLAGMAVPAAAQMPRACDDFTTQSIHVEPGGFLGSAKIVSGITATPVLKLGFRTANLDTLMQVSDSALAYSIDYGRHARRGTVLMGLTLLTSVVPPLFVDFSDKDNNGIKWTSFGVTGVLGLWGSVTNRRAQRSLARAVWHYNVGIAQRAHEPCVAMDPDQVPESRLVTQPPM